MKITQLISLPKDLQLILWGNFLWSLGAMSFQFIWPIFIRDLGGGAREIGIISSIMFLTVALSIIPGGILADRYDRKKLILITWLIAAPAPLIYIFADAWYHLIPGAILYCIFIGWPALEAYIAQAARRGEVTRAFTLTYAGFAAGVVLGPLLGSVILQRFPINYLFILAFILFCASTIVFFFISPQRPLPKEENEQKESLKTLQWQEMRYLVCTRKLLPLISFLCLTALVISISRPFIAPFLQDRFTLHEAVLLRIGAIIGVGEFILAVLLGWIGDRQQAWRALTLGLIFVGIAALGLILTPLLFGAFLAVFFFGADRVSGTLHRPVIYPLIQAKTAGMGFALYLFLVSIAQSIGPLIGGFLYDLAPRAPFILTGALSIFAAFVLVMKQETRKNGQGLRSMEQVPTIKEE
ncbi:MFS transporter [Candidatus Acetothermia bacterium]|nr:MFS transporter [Candidatus Acetothermia bacterium]